MNPTQCRLPLTSRTRDGTTGASLLRPVCDSRARPRPHAASPRRQYFVWWGTANGTLFDRSPSLLVGVMPAFVLSLRLMGHSIEQLHLSDDATHLYIRTNRSGGDRSSAGDSTGASDGGATAVEAAPVAVARLSVPGSRYF